MPKVFISYRRSDSRTVSGRINSDLERAFGKSTVFKDVDDIPPGKDFRDVLRAAISKCRVMLVVIGPHWATAVDSQGKRRLEDPGDFVRLEVESGLGRDGVTVIPLLVEGAQMPRPDDLPESMRALTYNNAFSLHDDPHFSRDMETLIRVLTPLIETGDGMKRAIAIGAGVLVVLVAALLILPRLLDPNPPPEQSADVITPIRTELPASTSAAMLATEAPTATRTSRPTSPPATDEPAPDLAFEPVNSNAEWTPEERSFNGVAMMRVPPGCFTMGAFGGETNEQPLHEQCFDEPFWISRYEVSNIDYWRFIEAGGYENPDYWTDAGWNWVQENGITLAQDYDGFMEPDQPRVGVNWYEASAYAVWREARLPTEAEWEYAARGPDGLEFPWGERFITANLSFIANSQATSPVDGRPAGASWVGAYHMSGNAWEWTSSLFMDYPFSPDDGREDGSSPDLRSVRGGGWNFDRYFARTSFRNYLDPEIREFYLGFRLARDESS